MSSITARASSATGCGAGQRDRAAGLDAALLARPAVAVAAPQTLSTPGLLVERQLDPHVAGAHRHAPAAQPDPGAAERGPLIQAGAATIPDRPERLARAADPHGRDAQHQLRPEHADIAPGLQRPAAEPPRHRARRQGQPVERGGSRVAEPAAVGQRRQGDSVLAMAHPPEGYHTVQRAIVTAQADGSADAAGAIVD